jgi:hypothetical protein
VYSGKFGNNSMMTYLDHSTGVCLTTVLQDACAPGAPLVTEKK